MSDHDGTTDKLARMLKDAAAVPNTHSEILIDARSIELRIPVMTAADRRLGSNPTRLVSDFIFPHATRKLSTLLEAVTFKLRAGERLGVIGKNGAGKSTLLRVLAGIYKPTNGFLEVHGVAKGLFDLTLGMQPQATGLENIYLRGLQMGLHLREVRNRIPEVEEFSELGEDLRKPLATYSSGMRLRLAIAVSTMIRPDILLLDEWIGTGDAAFNAKIKTRMSEILDTSRGLVIATHNETLMKNLCTSGLVLQNGKSMFHGPLADALEFYRGA